MKLTAHRYGKSRVRVLKVLRAPSDAAAAVPSTPAPSAPTSSEADAVHTVKEITVRVLLEGAFDRCFTDADNTQVVATDTMKNTVQVLAHEHLGLDNEPFAQRLAAHFLDRYPQVDRVAVTIDERPWTRLAIGGRPHPHAFMQARVARPFARVVATRDAGMQRESGIRDLLLLKSTGSGFEQFHRDDLTTLPDTRERMLASAVRARWRWQRDPAAFDAANRAIAEALIVPFAERYSPSVQATLYDMARAALDACAEIDRVSLTMPNLHCLPIDLTPFGRTNRHEIFVPTDEPHGYIEATVSR